MIYDEVWLYKICPLRKKSQLWNPGTDFISNFGQLMDKIILHKEFYTFK